MLLDGHLLDDVINELDYREIRSHTRKTVRNL